MAMHTEATPRLPAWLVAALVAAGVTLGLWHGGVFERSTDGSAGASVAATLDQLRAVAGTPAVGAAVASSASTSKRPSGSAGGRPVTGIDRLASDKDTEVRAESAALQEALAAEQASD